MLFWISVSDNFENNRYLVEHQILDEQKEVFLLTVNYNLVVIQSNRPYILNQGLSAQPELLIIQGNVSRLAHQQKILIALAEWFDRLPVCK